MNETQSAIEKLKAKAASINGLTQALDEHKVALANFVDKSVFNVDWNEKDHPRDPHTGEFIELGHGMFMFGKVKPANFAMADGSKHDVEIPPGATAYRTKAGNVAIAHADGTYTLHNETGTKVSIHADSFTAKAIQAGQLEKIGENPGVKVPAANQSEAADKLENPAKYDPNDTSTPTIPSAQKQALADKDAALPNTITHGGKVFNLTPGQKAYKSGGADSGTMVVIDPDGTLNYYKDNGEQWTDWDQSQLGSWWATMTKNKSYDLVAEGNASVSDAPAGSPEELNAKTDELLSGEAPAKGNFVHPVSGAEFPVNAGDKVYQHKASPDSFIIAGEGEPVFFNKNGKQQKVPAHTLKKLDTNYKDVSDSFPGMDSQKSADTSPDTPSEAPVEAPKDQSAPDAPAAPEGGVKNLTQESAVSNLKEALSKPKVAESVADTPAEEFTPKTAMAFLMKHDLSVGAGEKLYLYGDTAYLEHTNGDMYAYSPEEKVFYEEPVAPSMKTEVQAKGIMGQGAPEETPKATQVGTPVDPADQAYADAFKKEIEKGSDHLDALAAGKAAYDAHKAGSAAPEPTAADKSPFVQDGAFIHPVAGKTDLTLQPGDVVKQHKIVPESFLVVHADGSMEKINKNGKVGAPGTAVKVANTNYNDVYTHSDEETKAGAPAPAASSLPDIPEEDFGALPDLPGGPLLDWEKELLGYTTDVPEAPADPEGPDAWTFTGSFSTIHYKKTPSGDWEVSSNGKAIGEISNEGFEGEKSVAKGTWVEGIVEPEPEVEKPADGDAVLAQHFSQFTAGDKVTYSTSTGSSILYVKMPGSGMWKNHDGTDFTDAELKTLASIGSMKVGDHTPPPEPPKKKVAKKVGADAHKHELPNGNVVTVGPGELFAQVPIKYAGTTQNAFILIKKEYGDNEVWDQDGNPLSVGKYLKKIEVKKQVKAHEATGATIIDEYKVTLAKVSVDDYEADPIEEKTFFSASNASEKAKAALMEVIPMSHSYWNGWSLDGWTDIKDSKGETTQWVNLSNEEKLLKFGQLEVPAGKGASTLAAVAKWSPDEIDKAEKTAISKDKTRLASVNRLALLAQALVDPDTDWSEEKFAEEMAFSAQKADKPGVSFGKDFPFPIEQFHSIATSINTQRKFKASLTGLDFDPYNASPEEYDKYAKDNDQHHLSALTPEDQKTWVLGHLGDPTISTGTKNGLTKQIEKAKAKAAIAELAGYLKAQNAKNQTLPDTPSPVEGQGYKGVQAKLEMPSEYHWTDSEGSKHVLINVGNDEWAKKKNGEKQDTYNDAQVQNLLVNLKKFFSDSLTEKGKAYNGKTLSEGLTAFEEQYDMKLYAAGPSQLNAAISLAGGTYVGKMDTAQKKEWINHAAIGDEIGKFKVEHDAVSKGTTLHKNLYTHPGSWESDKGKAAYAALGGVLSQTDWGKKTLAGQPLSSEDAQQAFDDLNLTPLSLLYQNKPAKDVPQGIVVKTWANWKSSHLSPPQLKAANAGVTPVNSTVYEKPVIEKPNTTTDEAWDLVENVADDSDLSSLIGSSIAGMSESEVDQSLSNSQLAKNNGIYGPLLGGVPLNVKRLAVWSASANQYGDDENKTTVMSAVAAKVKGGSYLEANTPVWIAPGGTKYPISPGAQVWKYNNGSYNQYIITGPPNADGSLSSGYEVSKSYSGEDSLTAASSYKLQSLSDYSYEKVFTMPGAITWQKYKAENPDAYMPYWAWVEDAEAGKHGPYTSGLTGAALTFELKNSDKIKSGYPHIYQQIKTLPEGVRQLALGASEEHEDSILDIIEHKVKEGHYASAQSLPMFDPAKPYAKHISLGQMAENEVQSYWLADAKSMYVSDFGLTDESEIAPHISSLLNPPTLSVAESFALPDKSGLQLTKLQSHNLDGMHTKYQWTDQNGNPWMSKTFQSDPQKEMRIDAEDAANKIGVLFGFKQPVTHVMKLDGEYSYVQHLAPATGTLASKSPKDLNVKQLSQAMEEHINDWLVSNHDSHAKNLMLNPNGDIFGIDKGQAFKFFPQDQLAHGYLPPGNGAPVWYDQFYSAIKNGSLPKETVDAVVKNVLRRAQKISKNNDAEYRGLLEYGLGKRTSWPAQYPTREAFIDGLIERKHDVFEDFVDFYKGLYASSPHTFDIDTENLAPPKLDDHTHMVVSQDLAEDVKIAGTHGKALFFNSSDLEDSHILLAKVTGTDGKDMLSGEAKIRKDGDLLLHNWLKSQTIEKHVSSQYNSYNDPYAYEPDPVPNTPTHTDIPGSHAWSTAAISGSKTVSSHAGDKEYNQATLANMQKAKESIEEAMDSLKTWEEENPTKPYQGEIDLAFSGLGTQKVQLVTGEQQEAWKASMQQYLDNIAQVEKHKEEGTKVSPHFGQYTYSPSAGLNTSGEPAQVEKWSGDNQIEYAKYDDGSYVMFKNDKMVKMTYAEYKAVTDSQVLTALEPDKAPSNEEPVDTTNVKEWTQTFPDGSTFVWKHNGDAWTAYINDVPQIGMSLTEEAFAAKKENEADTFTAKSNVLVPTWTSEKGAKFVKVKGGWEYTNSSGVKKDGLFTDEYVKDFTEGAPQKWEHNANVTDDGDAEVSSEIQVGTKVLKVTYKKAHSKGGQFDSATGELKMDGAEHTQLNSGHMYEIDFGGSVIEYRPWDEPGVPTAQKGLLRFYKKGWDGDGESIDEVMDALRHMGLDLTPADEVSMETTYWEHLLAVLKDRKGHEQIKWKKTIDHAENEFKAKPQMSNEERLAMLREAWALSMGQSVVDNADWKPKFSRLKPHLQAGESPSETQGHPYWLRPDVTLSDMKKYYGDSLPMSSIGNGYDMPEILASGGLYSTEQRMRLLGKPLGGASSDSDQGYGSSTYLFLRQGIMPGGSLSLGSWDSAVLLHPRVAMRTTNYAYNGDNFGNAELKKTQAEFDLSKASKMTNSSNELMVKNAISLLDDTVISIFPNASVREEALKKFKAMGVTMLHGLPLEDVFVTSTAQAKKIMPKVWDQILKEEENA